MLDGLAAGCLSRSTLNGVRNALVAVFTDAARARHLRAASNPARRAVMPDATPAAVADPPTAAQLRALLDASCGTEQDPRNVRKMQRPIAESVGLPGSFHQLRNYAATVDPATTGGDDVAVARMLGHANAATTRDVYRHLLGEYAVAISPASEGHLAG
ncbi:MAG: hypothetical protein RLZ55_850 [Actinomycetota bacterium]